jgi:hypothetical protein
MILANQHRSSLHICSASVRFLIHPKAIIYKYHVSTIDTFFLRHSILCFDPSNSTTLFLSFPPQAKFFIMNNKSQNSILPSHHADYDGINFNATEVTTITGPNRNDFNKDSDTIASTQSIHNDGQNNVNTGINITIDTWIALAPLCVAIMQFGQGFYF